MRYYFLFPKVYEKIFFYQIEEKYNFAKFCCYAEELIQKEENLKNEFIRSGELSIIRASGEHGNCDSITEISAVQPVSRDGKGHVENARPDCRAREEEPRVGSAAEKRRIFQKFSKLKQQQ